MENASGSDGEDAAGAFNVDITLWYNADVPLLLTLRGKTSQAEITPSCPFPHGDCDPGAQRAAEEVVVHFQVKEGPNP